MGNIKEMLFFLLFIYLLEFSFYSHPLWAASDLAVFRLFPAHTVTKCLSKCLTAINSSSLLWKIKNSPASLLHRLALVYPASPVERRHLSDVSICALQCVRDYNYAENKK